MPEKGAHDKSAQYGDKPIVALDIDGTLGNYHLNFLRFAELYLGKPMPAAEDINPGLPLFNHMGVSKSTYRKCKLAYRQGGAKRWMPCYDGAADLTRSIRASGALVFICTTRPYLRLDNIDPDTRHWLRRNRIQYDAVLWGEYKYRDLVRGVGAGRVVCVLDDLPDMLAQADTVGIKREILRKQPYNLDGIAHADYAVGNMVSAKHLILSLIQGWKRRESPWDS